MNDIIIIYITHASAEQALPNMDLHSHAEYHTSPHLELHMQSCNHLMIKQLGMRCRHIMDSDHNYEVKKT